MKIFTIGNGFVTEHLKFPQIEARLDLSAKQIENILDHYKPDVLINCIGKTGRPNIDWCESHKTETADANTALPILLASECAKKSIRMIHIGSGCIFFGASPNHKTKLVEGAEPYDTGWTETDFANPQSHYSKTKYATDLVLGDLPHVTTLRIRMPISTKNHSRNLINKLKQYKQVINIPNSVTFMDDFVKCVDWVIAEEKSGIYHVTNPNPITAAQIMQEYQYYDNSHTFEIIGEKDLDKLTIAKRSNCILSSDKLKNEGFLMQNASEALQHCMKKYIKN